MINVNLEQFIIEEYKECYFRIFAACMPVKGASRSIICDLQRETFDYIPNDIFSILNEFNSDKISAILKTFGEDNKSILEDYFYFLLKEEYIFLIEEMEELKHFPSIDLTWESPHKIENAIIDVGPNSNHPYREIIYQLSSLGCRAIQIRFFHKYMFSNLKDIICLFDGTRIEFVELYIKYDKTIDFGLINEI